MVYWLSKNNTKDIGRTELLPMPTQEPKTREQMCEHFDKRIRDAVICQHIDNTDRFIELLRSYDLQTYKSQKSEKYENSKNQNQNQNSTGNTGQHYANKGPSTPKQQDSHSPKKQYNKV